MGSLLRIISNVNNLDHRGPYPSTADTTAATRLYASLSNCDGWITWDIFAPNISIAFSTCLSTLRKGYGTSP